MNNSIAEKIVELVSPVVEIFKQQTEVNATPYAVYEIVNAQPFYKKSGVYKWEASVVITIIAENESDAVELGKAVANALPDRGVTFKFKIENITSDIADNQWSYSINYSVTQYI